MLRIIELGDIILGNIIRVENRVNHNGVVFGSNIKDISGCSYDDIEVIERCWYNGNQVIHRPTMNTTLSTNSIPADGTTVATLQAVAGTLTVGAETYEVEAGEIELTFDTPGEYRIRLEAFPYLPFEAVIHAY